MTEVRQRRVPGMQLPVQLPLEHTFVQRLPSVQ
jgi:hypothetical protein